MKISGLLFVLPDATKRGKCVCVFDGKLGFPMFCLATKITDQILSYVHAYDDDDDERGDHFVFYRVRILLYVNRYYHR